MSLYLNNFGRDLVVLRREGQHQELGEGAVVEIHLADERLEGEQEFQNLRVTAKFDDGIHLLEANQALA